MKVHLTAGLTAIAAVFAGPAFAADDITTMSAAETASAIAGQTLTATDLVNALIARTGDDPGNVYITFDSEGALAAAAAADESVKAGEPLGPLHGVPIVVKDNIASAGLPTTGGTPALKGWVPAEDAPVLKKLRDAGAILLGKTNLHELAFGITSNNAAFGAVANAYDPDRFAGGSSGGTGAAIGARLAPAGLGTDTGGSVRIPSALNGVSGLRPTTGRYPAEGIVPISATRDTPGPIARTVSDLVLLDAVITGSTATLDPADLGTVRLGVPGVLTDNLSPETDRLFKEALDKLQAAGVTLVPVDISTELELAGKAGFPIALWEVKRDLAAFLETHETGLGLQDIADEVASPDVKFVFDNLVLGNQAIPDAVYREAMDDMRPLIQAGYAEVFAANKLDALVFPTTPLPAQPITGSDETVSLNGADVPTFPTFIRNTDPGSVAGIPGLSLPAGLTSDGLPVGLELDGPAYSDRHLLALGLAVEAVLPHLPAPASN
ncbi:indoleacetamide hydrolase [Roseibium aggregatum]|uniref:indoleacetamide hydrolase n=1 Tax=Roseibium aggregatum TaxID=187304 RepID=UPI001E569779|nr:indoleacetamide hydrolase [Roseibium aggregatum]UES38343.1 indoleacetamide hydrolase [Roseibium aggregatum]